MAFEAVKETVSAVRSIRKDKGIPARDRLELLIRADKGSFDAGTASGYYKALQPFTIFHLYQKNLLVPYPSWSVPPSTSFRSAEAIDVEGELKKLNEELVYNQGFLVSVMKKLDNQRFVQNAPAAGTGA